MSPEDNPKLITVTWPVSVPPLCLQLALGTRVCAVRVDSAEVLYQTVSMRWGRASSIDVQLVDCARARKGVSRAAQQRMQQADSGAQCCAALRVTFQCGWLARLVSAGVAAAAAPRARIQGRPHDIRHWVRRGAGNKSSMAAAFLVFSLHTRASLPAAG